MARLNRLIKISIFVFGVLFGANYCFATDTVVLWEKEFGCGGGLSCSPGRAAFAENDPGDPNDDRLLILGTSFDPNDYSQKNFRLWKIDPSDGDELVNTVIKDANHLRASIALGAMHINGLRPLEDGSAVAVGDFNNHERACFIKINENNNIILNKYVEEENEKICVNDLIQIPDDNSIIVGHEFISNHNGLIIKIDSQGSILWKKTYKNYEEAGIFYDVTVVGNQGVSVVSGTSIDPNDGSTNIWISRFDNQGNKDAEVFFAGSPVFYQAPQICQLDSNDFVVVYQKSPHGQNPDYQIRGLAPNNLGKLWEKQVVQSGKKSGCFRIKAVPDTNAGFVVAGSTDTSDVDFFEYDEDGNLLSSKSMGKLHAIVLPSLDCSKDKAFVVIETVSKSGGLPMRKVKVIAFELQ